MQVLGRSEQEKTDNDTYYSTREYHPCRNLHILLYIEPNQLLMQKKTNYTHSDRVDLIHLSH